MDWTKRFPELARNPRWAHVLWLAIATLVSLLHLFVNTLNIAHGDMVLDDAGTWGVSHRSFWTLFTLPTEFHSQPPLYYFLLHFVLKIGSAPWLLRGISWVFCWMLLLFVLFYWHELRPLSRLAFSLIFIFARLTEYLATCVRPYGMAAFLTLVATVSLFRLAKDPCARRGVVYVAWTTAMLYTMAFEIAVLMVHGLVMVGAIAATAVRRSRPEAVRRVKILALTMLALCAAYVPYLAMAYHYQYNANPRNTLTTILKVATYTGTLEQQLGFSKEFTLGLVILAGLGLIGELRRGEWLVLTWPLMIVGSIGFVWYFIVGRSILGAQSKYMMPAFVAACALFALGFEQLRPWANRGFWPAMAVLLAFFVYSKFPAFDHFMHAGPDVGPFGVLGKALQRYPGKKIFFNDIGFDSQCHAYATREDPTIVYATMPGPGWASAGDNHITDEYVFSTIERNRADTKCFFYFVWGTNGPVSSAFVPTMQRLGFQPTPPLPAVSGHQTLGYCQN